MNELERFKTVVHFEKPDYWPLILTLGTFTVTKGGMFKLQPRPLMVYAGGTWGNVRNLMGPERALYAV